MSNARRALAETILAIRETLPDNHTLLQGKI